MEYNNLDFLEEKAKELRQRLDGDFEDLDMTEMMNELGVDIKDLEDKMLNHRTKLPLQFNKLHPDATTPKYNYEGDSGFDLHSIDEIVIPPFGRALVPTGLSFDIKDGYEIQVRTKSGLAINQGLMILNSPGTVDSSYTGEIKGIIFNTNPFEFTIPKGMKIGQAVLCPVVNGGWVDLIEVNKINEKDRGENGFGSTGINMNLIVNILEKYNINGFDKPGGTDKATYHSYDTYYVDVLKNYMDKEIVLMEIGVQYGGSALLWNDLFPKSKMVFLDNEDIVDPKIWDLMDKNRYDFIVKDAFCDETIQILKDQYKDGFDVIIEDGPHTLDSQIFAIKHYSELLKPGGILIIEDIQSYDYCDVIINEIDKTNFNSVEIVDLRNNKNRYDDLLIVVKK